MAETELPPEGTSRREFVRRMAKVGLLGVPVVASFSLVGGCIPCLPGSGGNTTNGGNLT